MNISATVEDRVVILLEREAEARKVKKSWIVNEALKVYLKEKSEGSEQELSIERLHLIKDIEERLRLLKTLG